MINHRKPASMSHRWFVAFFKLVLLTTMVSSQLVRAESQHDILDHAQSIVAYLAFYPRPTLGPGQRFVNKGGYVLPIIDGEPVTQDAAWILP